MTKKPAEKLLIGPRLRRLRQTLGLTQARMAQDLDISTSYLNLIERNQRPMSTKVLLRLSEVYDFNMAELSGRSDAALVASLHDVMRDPVIGAGNVSRQDLEDIVGINPEVGQAVLKLYKSYRRAALSGVDTPDEASLLAPATRATEAVRSYLQTQKNYFLAIDTAAEALSRSLSKSGTGLSTALTLRLKDRHGLSVRVVPVSIMPEMLRYFDRHSKRINISELMPASGRTFQMAYQIGMIEHREMIDGIISEANFESKEAERLCRTSLANYFAAAVLMPYGRFLKEAESCKYDIELLSHRFSTSFEQTAHRLTTLQKPDARGIPFFFVRIDTAGNVSKRFSAGRFHFSDFGGACPLWNIHDAFQTPEAVRTQIIQMPDDTTYFSIARTVTRTGGAFGRDPQKLAIGLGCDIAYAARLIYADGLNLETASPTPIGINCQLCDRENCRQRAHAPLNRKLTFDERARGMSIFRFES